MKYFMLSVAFFLSIAQVSAQYKGTPATAAGYRIGDVATDFSLKNVDESFVSMDNYTEAMGFVLVFTCNHCPYSVLYEDRLIALDKQIKPLGFQMIAINPNDPEIYEGDSFELMQVRAKEKGFTFPYLFDAGQVVFPQYGATKTPHVFVLDAEYKVQYIGAIDDNASEPEAVEETYLLDAVKAIADGKSPSPTTTKAIGCSIRVMN